MSFHGLPIWFELSISDPDAAQGFYSGLMGWDFVDSGMPDFDYRLGKMGAAMVAGVMPLALSPPGTPPNWMIYIGVEDCDAVAARVEGLGGKVWADPADIPGTGRFAVLGDPQGAVFGVLQPLPMETPPEVGAYDQTLNGHAQWIELMSPDPAAAMGFYATLFGWTADCAVEMGPMGTYHLFANQGCQIGGMMGLAGAPVPYWLPYFGVADVAAALAQASATGGALVIGPNEVPGPALVAVLRDPQGAHFAVVGPKP
ncbi:MAG: VOC family protein [Sphingomonadales bacterium]|nr:VOC family protein [Sphingomonadales bacterium]